MVEQVKERITAETYYQLAEYVQRDLIELINGQVIIPMPPVIRHQLIVTEILLFLGFLAKQTGGKALTAPSEVYLDENNVFEPDVLYIAPDTQCTLEEKRVRGAPDLVVEVLSPSTAKYDRGDKYRAYERHGVREYWIVDPLHDTLEVWTLVERQFQRQGAYASGMSFTSSVLATEVDVKAIFDV